MDENKSLNGNEIPDAKRNWRDVIADAKQRGTFTDDEKKRSGDWFSCACGKLDPRLKRLKDGEPVDQHLCDLGVDFEMSVRDDCFNLALLTLNRIETRESELLRELAMNAPEEGLSKPGETTTQKENNEGI